MAICYQEENLDVLSIAIALWVSPDGAGVFWHWNWNSRGVCGLQVEFHPADPQLDLSGSGVCVVSQHEAQYYSGEQTKAVCPISTAENQSQLH